MKNIFSSTIKALFIALTVMILGALLMIPFDGIAPATAVLVSAFIHVVFYFADKFVSEKFAYTGLCGRFSANININCLNPLQAGTRDRAIILNFEDVIGRTYAADGITVEAITLASGTQGYVIDGQKNSIAPKSTMVARTFTNMFDHEVTMKGFDISPVAKKQVNELKDSRVIIITENYYQGTDGNSAFEIYGLTVGLVAVEIERDPNSEETEGAFHFKFMTDRNKEPKTANTFYDTDYATTKALVDALL